MSFPRYPKYKDSGVEWLGAVPAHWELVPLKQVISRIESGTSVNAIDTPAGDGELGVLKTSCVYHGHFDADENKAVIPDEYDRVACPVTAGTLVVSRMNTPDLVGAAGVVHVSHENLFLPDRLWQVHFDGADPNFVHHWTHTPAYRAQVEMACAGTSSSMQNLGQDQFRSFVIPRPSFGEQTAIATFLDRETAKIDALVAEQEKLIALLQEKRQAVISHAVTKGLDPNVPMKDSGVEWLGEVPTHWAVGGLTRFIGPVVDYRGRTPTKVDEGIFLVTARNIRDGRIDYEASEEFVDPDSAASLLARGKPEIDDLLFTMEAPLGQVALIDRTDIALAQRVVKFRGVPSLMRNSYLLYWLMSTGCQSRLETLATGSTALGIKASKLGMIECLAPPLDEQDSIVALIKHETAKLDTLTAEARSAITLLQERRTALISAAVTGQIDVRGLAGGANAPDLIA